MNARDFYYTVIASEEKYASYQKVHGQALDAKIVDHRPRLSNDILLERILESFAASSDPAVARRIQSCFVAKRREYVANAYALLSSSRYSGDLIFFYVGLSDACFQYTITYSDFLAVCLARLKKPVHAPDVQERTNDLVAKLRRLEVAQRRWLATGLISLADQDVLSPREDLTPSAATLAWYTDWFILAHEVAHHLLGHTGQFDDARAYLKERLPYLCRLWQKEESEIRKELEADALGLLLVLGLCRQEVAQASIGPELPTGALLTISVLGQCGRSASVDSRSHPAPSRRYQQAKNILQSLWPHQYRSFVFRDIERFQVLLSLSQGRGIGETDKRTTILQRAKRLLRRPRE